MRNKLFYYTIFTSVLILYAKTSVHALPCDDSVAHGGKVTLMFPYDFNNFTVQHSTAVELCAKNGASLVEIQSSEKQIQVEYFLIRNGVIDFSVEQNIFYSHVNYWIGGQRDSGDTKKFKWSKSGTQFSYTNWHFTTPGDEPNNFTYIIQSKDDAFGKWETEKLNFYANVFCECN